MRPCQFFWQIFLPIFFEAHRRWDPANIFCKYLGQYFFEAHHRWGPADIFQLVTKLENPSWTKTHTDWSKFSCSFFCEYSWCGTKELLAWDNIDQFLHKIRSSTVKFFLESSEYCDKLVYEKIEEKNTLLHWIVSIQGCVRMLQSCLYQQKGNWNIAIVWTYSSGHLYSHWNNCQLIRDGDVVLNEGIFEQSVAKKLLHNCQRFQISVTFVWSPTASLYGLSTLIMFKEILWICAEVAHNCHSTNSD